MLPQTIAILSSEQKKSRNFCQMLAGLVSLSSWVLIFYDSKEFPDGVGCWLCSAASSSAPPSVLSSAASSSSGKYIVLVPGLLVSGGPDGAMNPALSSPGLPCSALLCACLLSRNGFSCVLFQESQTGDRTS